MKRSGRFPLPGSDEHFPVAPGEVGAPTEVAVEGRTGARKGRRGVRRLQGRGKGDAQPALPRQRPVAETVQLLERGLSRLEGEIGRQASMNEVAAGMGVSLEEYLFMLEEVYPVPLFTSSTPLEGFTTDKGEFVAALADFLFDECLVEAVARSIWNLPEKERQVLMLRHQHRLSSLELCAMLKIPESEVKQLYSQAIIRVRAGLNATPIRGRYSA